MTRAGILADPMVDPTQPAISPDAAERGVALLAELSPDLRGAAIATGDGSVLASSGDDERWSDDARALLAAADGAEDEPVEQVHIATEQGEVFALRQAGLLAVAVTERFALASLLFFDLRSTLRDLARGGEV
jgi:predicted regulator of Ras-like GTPase activity (Roadblock/LC7/MglB family)